MNSEMRARHIDVGLMQQAMVTIALLLGWCCALCSCVTCDANTTTMVIGDSTATPVDVRCPVGVVVDMILNMSMQHSPETALVVVLHTRVRCINVSAQHRPSFLRVEILEDAVEVLPAIHFPPVLNAPQSITIIISADTGGRAARLGVFGPLLSMPASSAFGGNVSFILASGSNVAVVSGDVLLHFTEQHSELPSTPLVGMDVSVSLMRGSVLVINGTNGTPDNNNNPSVTPPSMFTGGCSTTVVCVADGISLSTFRMELVGAKLTLRAVAPTEAVHVFLSSVPQDVIVLHFIAQSIVLVQCTTGSLCTLLNHNHVFPTLAGAAGGVTADGRVTAAAVSIQIRSGSSLLALEYGEGDGTTNRTATIALLVAGGVLQTTHLGQSRRVSVDVRIESNSSLYMSGPNVIGCAFGAGVTHARQPMVAVSAYSRLEMYSTSSSGAATPTPATTALLFMVLAPNETPFNGSVGLVDLSVSAHSVVTVNGSEAALVRVRRLSSIQVALFGGWVDINSHASLRIVGPGAALILLLGPVSWISPVISLTSNATVFISSPSSVTAALIRLTQTIQDFSLSCINGCRVQLDGAQLLEASTVRNASVAFVGERPTAASTSSDQAAVWMLRARLVYALIAVERVTITFGGTNVSLNGQSAFLSSRGWCTSCAVVLSNVHAAVDASEFISATTSISNASVEVGAQSNVTLRSVSSLCFSLSAVHTRVVVDGRAAISCSDFSALIRGGSTQPDSSHHVSMVVRGASYLSLSSSSRAIQYATNCCNASVEISDLGSSVVLSGTTSLTHRTTNADVVVRSGAAVTIGAGTTMAALVTSASRRVAVVVRDGSKITMGTASAVVVEQTTGGTTIEITVELSSFVYFQYASSAPLPHGWLAVSPSAAAASILLISLRRMTFASALVQSGLFRLPAPLWSGAFTPSVHVFSDGGCRDSAVIRRNAFLVEILSASDVGVRPDAFVSPCAASKTATLRPTPAVSRSNTSDVTLSLCVSTSTSISQIVIPPPPPPEPVINKATTEQVGATAAATAALAGAAGVAPSVVRATMSLSMVDCSALSLYGVAAGNSLNVNVGSPKGASHRGLALWTSLVIIVCCLLGVLCATGLWLVRTYALEDPSVTLRGCFSKLRLPGLLCVPFLLFMQPLVASTVALLQVSASDVVMSLVMLIVAIACTMVAALFLTKHFGAQYRLAEDVDEELWLEVVHPRLFALQKFFRGALLGDVTSDWQDVPGRSGFVDRFGRWFHFFRPGREWYLVVEAAISAVCGLAQGVAASGGDPECRVGQVLLAASQIAALVIIVVLRPYTSRFRQVLAVLISLCGGIFGFLLLLLPLCPITCQTAAEVLTVIPSILALLMPVLKGCYLATLATGAVLLLSKGKRKRSSHSEETLHPTVVRKSLPHSTSMSSLSLPTEGSDLTIPPTPSSTTWTSPCVNGPLLALPAGMVPPPTSIDLTQRHRDLSLENQREELGRLIAKICDQQLLF